MDGILMSSRPKGWPRHAYQKRAGAIFFGFVAVFAAWMFEWQFEWDGMQKYYLAHYVVANTGLIHKYLVLHTVDRKGKWHPTIPDEVVPVNLDHPVRGVIPFRLSDAAIQAGAVRLANPLIAVDQALFVKFLRNWVYDGETLGQLLKPGMGWGFAVMVFGLCFAWPADKKARRILEDGRRVRGAEMVTRDEFNQRRKYNLGIGFKTLEKPSLREKLWIKYPYGPMIVIPEWDEPKHFLLMGDTGSGKSALMRQILWQLTKQQETAIVYDPAREYVERFYNPERGDIILNPLDARAPYWNPGDELLDTTVSGARGLLTTSETPAGWTSTSYYDTGNPYSVVSSTGNWAAFSADSATNYSAPMTITTESYAANVSYNAWLGITQTTGYNGEQLSMTYDSTGRPTSGTSPFGGVTNYTYSTAGALPMWQTETGPNGVTVTTLDGFGRATRVTREDGHGTVQSYQDTVYAPCACSPLGKIQKVSMPYYTGEPAAPVYTTYTYDGLGRTVSVQKPDGASTTTYSYLGNQTTVTDPAGKWKTFTKDVLGNLLTVLEPDPSNQPSGTVTTSYRYDWMNHVACVDMDRGGTLTTAYTYTSNGVSCTTVYTAGTGTRQTRTFVYSDAGLLTSATNPENGTVTYTYNSTNTLNTRTDAKGQFFVYTYDSSNRVTQIQKYPQGQYNPEDVCARVNYVYGENPYGDPPYSYGRLISASTLQIQGTCTSAPSYSESYSYGAPGNVLSKTVTSSVAPWGSTPVSINYSYDSYGRTVSVQYPFQGTIFNYVTFTTAYDSMGRPSGLTDSNGNTWVNSAGYDYAGRLQTLDYLGVTETRSYNTVGQLATIGWANSNTGQPGFGNPVGTPTLTYTYSATQNNGQITQATDGLTGETTVYQYDALKRLTSASNSVWNETFGYDGFGNLTGKTLNGTLQSIPVNSATNQLSGPTYDLNGNMTVGAGATMTYNEDNRMSSAQESSGGAEYEYYTPDGKRFYRSGNSNPQFTLYGVRGEALATYSYSYTDATGEMSVYFGGRRLWQAPYYSSSTGSNGVVFADRLGSNRYVQSSPASGSYYIANYYPYGDASGTASQDQVGFATYTQDSYTGLSYANQRFYASTYGNFTSPDPSMENVDYTNPGSWNAYAYTNGDPINGNDPTGLQTCGQTPIVGGAFNGQTVSQVFTGTSGNDLLAQEIWHEGGTIYSSDLTSQASTSAYAQDLAAIGTAILNQWDVDDGRLKVYQNGRAVCPLGQCLDRSLAQIIETIATYSSGGQMVSVFNSSGQMQGPAAATLSGILGTNIDSGPLVLDSSGQYVNQGCEGVLASLVTGSGLLGGTTPRVSPNGLTLLFWNQASATSTTTFPGNVGYTGWRDARTRGETFWGLSSTAPPPIRRPPPRRPR